MTTPETTSNVGSENLKTPTTETATPFSGPSLPKPKQPLKSATSKKPNKTPKTKKNQIPKENTTSPPETKTYSNTKTKPLKSRQEHNIPTGAKQAQATKNMTTTSPQKSSVSQQITKCPSTTPEKSICTSAKTDPTPTSQPSKTESIENSKIHFDTLVCYAKKNYEIALELKQFLERKYSLKVCMDLFNFVPGKATTDNICESINSSQSIVFLLSPEFLRKLWGQWELKNAVYDFNVSQKNGKSKKIIPVLLEECQVPDDLKLYTPIKMERSGLREGSWKKIAQAVLGRPFHGNGNDIDDADGVELSVDDVDVSNDCGGHDEVDDSIHDDNDDVLDGYGDGGDDSQGDTSSDGADNVGINADGSNNAVRDSNGGGSYHGENDVDGRDSCGVEDDDDDGVGTGSDNEEDHGDDGGNDDVITHDGSDDDSNDGDDDCNGGGDHDEDGHHANDSANNDADDGDIDGNQNDVGDDGVDHVDESVDNDAGDEERPNHNNSGIDGYGVGECDDSRGKNDDANNDNKTDVAYNNIKSL